MRLKATLSAIGLAGAALAAALPSMIAAAGEPSLGATTTTTTPATTSSSQGGEPGAEPTSTFPAGPGGPTTSGAGGEFTLPPGYEMLVDDTNRITVGVPSTWADRDTTSFSIDGVEIPRIIAATDIAVWEDTFDAPGVWFAAHPYTADLQTLLTDWGLTQGCEQNTTEEYDDGLFVGLWGQWTECGRTRTPEWHLIVASPPNQAFTALVIVQLTGPQDQAAMDVVLETFNTTSTASFPAPGGTTPGSTTTGPAVPGPGSTTTGPTVPTPGPTTTTPAIPGTTGPTVPTTGPTVPTPGPTTGPTVPGPGPTTTTPAVPGTTGPGTTTAPATSSAVIDATNLLTVSVPGTWTDRNVEPSRHDDGSDRPTLAASPDLAGYYETFSTPGVYMAALPPATEPSTLLANFTYSAACTDNGVTPFNDGRFVGSMQTFTACDGTQARIINIAARPIDNSFTLLLQIQLADADDTVLNQVLSSFGVAPGATYPQAVPPSTMAAPSGPVPAQLLTAPTTITLTTLSDNDGVFSVGIPSTWTETDVSSNLNDDGSDRARVAAAPVLDDFYNSWTAPGMQVVAYPYNSDPSVLLSNLGFADSCDDGGVQTFDNGALTGLMQTWSNCGATTSRTVMLAVSPPSQSVTLYIEVQLPDADDAPLQAVLSSVQVR